jgi:hypothetical protein
LTMALLLLLTGGLLENLTMKLELFLAMVARCDK